MNVDCSYTKQEARAILEQAKAETANAIAAELDSIFKHKITTPEEVIKTYGLLVEFEYYSGEKYKITFEENTIV